MFLLGIFSLSLFACATAFEPFIKNGVVIRGSTEPLVDFDPLGFSEKKDIAYLREAELKHGDVEVVVDSNEEGNGEGKKTE